ncbi:penicillin-binding protein 1A/penicillin-binding protein 1C [Nitrosomonas eutropha]|uniref:biosynthetic peptidoglycan transglycosylase n=1 Tax=Nitrosomonas eutropha TaxID=916 RepID=UPI00087E3D21|nr:penicillin-binding protein 1A/penicillin-binding protein 1C [Nitrosomonas eutropha]
MRKQIKIEWAAIKVGISAVERGLASGKYPVPPKSMEQLLIVGEDHRFWHHCGVDIFALCRAFWRSLHGSRQGGSTIAMQLVRTLTGSYERSFPRKVREVVLAILVTSIYGRERLPAYYISLAYYGWRMNSFSQACSRLRLDPLSMRSADAAGLVARLKYPEPRVTGARRKTQIKKRTTHLLSLAFSDQVNHPSVPQDAMWISSK